MYRRALDGYEKVWGLDHPSTLRTIKNLRLLNARRGRNKQPQSEYVKAEGGFAGQSIGLLGNLSQLTS